MTSSASAPSAVAPTKESAAGCDATVREELFRLASQWEGITAERALSDERGWARWVSTDVNVYEQCAAALRFVTERITTSQTVADTSVGRDAPSTSLLKPDSSEGAARAAPPDLAEIGRIAREASECPHCEDGKWTFDCGCDFDCGHPPTVEACAECGGTGHHPKLPALLSAISSLARERDAWHRLYDEHISAASQGNVELRASGERLKERVGALAAERDLMRKALRSIVKVARAEPAGTVLDTIYGIARDCFDAVRARAALRAESGEGDGVPNTLGRCEVHPCACGAFLVATEAGVETQTFHSKNGAAHRLKGCDPRPATPTPTTPPKRPALRCRSCGQDLIEGFHYAKVVIPPEAQPPAPATCPGDGCPGCAGCRAPSDASAEAQPPATTRPAGLYDPCWHCWKFRGAASRECDARAERVGPGETCSDLKPIAAPAPADPAPAAKEDVRG